MLQQKYFFHYIRSSPTNLHKFASITPLQLRFSFTLRTNMQLWSSPSGWLPLLFLSGLVSSTIHTQIDWGMVLGLSSLISISLSLTLSMIFRFSLSSLICQLLSLRLHLWFFEWNDNYLLLYLSLFILLIFGTIEL